MVLEGVTGVDLRQFFEGGLASLAEHQQEIDRLNVFPVPDGDTGRNMYLTMLAAVQELKQAVDLNVNSITEALAKGSLMGARGNSGVILSQLIHGFADAVKGKDEITPSQFAKAWQAAVAAAYHAVMKPVEGTILTVARGFSQGLNEAVQIEPDLARALILAVQKGNETLQLTPEMLPVLKKAGVVDAGGKGLLVFLEGGLNALSNGEHSPLFVNAELLPEQGPAEEENDFAFLYCVEFLLRGDSANVSQLRRNLQKHGGSLIVGNTDDIIKIHIHSNHPGEVLEHCLRRGTLHNIQISNMKDQYQQSRGQIEPQPKARSNLIETENLQEIGLLAVAAGEGIKEILRNLGAVQIVDGGQTMNPPVENFVRAIEAMPNRQVLILPNNKNLILAAEQTKQLVDRSIEVLPTTSIQAGISVLLAFNPSRSMTENRERMELALNRIKTAEVTYAVRDTVLKDIEIKQGSLIGLWGGEIVAVGASMEQVALSLVAQMLGEQDELATLYTGKGVTPEEADRIAALIRTSHPQLEVELQHGGQPVYCLLISVE